MDFRKFEYALSQARAHGNSSGSVLRPLGIGSILCWSHISRVCKAFDFGRHGHLVGGRCDSMDSRRCVQYSWMPCNTSTFSLKTPSTVLKMRRNGGEGHTNDQ